RDGALRGRDTQAAPREDSAQLERNVGHPSPSFAGARGRTPRGNYSPRHQASEHPDNEYRDRENPRLRAGKTCLGLATPVDDPNRPNDGDNPIHVSRATAWRNRRRSKRPVVFGSSRLRNVGRRLALSDRFKHRNGGENTP